MTPRSRRHIAPKLEGTKAMRPRARQLGVPFDGETGVNNAITDVPGVEVGFTTLIKGSGPLVVGEGPVRTGVTAILPRGKSREVVPVWAGMYTLNGNGEMTGCHWIEEAGYFLGPVCITNTHSLGMVHHGVIRWMVRRYGDAFGKYVWALPVVAETCDAYLNDMNGMHVTEAHVLSALDDATGGAVAEGNVGGGTGMITYEFKGGTGTASRIVELGGTRYTVAALVQANMGIRPWLTVRGAPVGKHMPEGRIWDEEQGSIIAILATDLPLLPIQLKRLARRIGLGVGRTGSPGGDNSGDIFLALSVANATPCAEEPTLGHHEWAPNEWLDPVFLATVESVEEAILNAMVAAETIEGRDSHRVEAIDREGLIAVMKRYGRGPET
jgi:D-aminopeptidase